jgi:peptidoglycan hydrolase-like protein with peptidoglycan-binding domain
MTVRAVSASRSASSTSSSEPVLRRGSTGPSVVALQNQLRTAGFDPGPSDGQFGPRTQAAVEAFQRAWGLTPDGVVGPRTWSALGGARGRPTGPGPSGHPTLRLGSTGGAVAQMQRDLARAGFDPGLVDGNFGRLTLGALRAFQRAHGLPVDGVCGSKTWEALSGSSFTPGPTPTPSGSPALKEGSSGPAVMKLQRLLLEAGMHPGPVDGKFGPGTLAAVASYQETRGLAVDGEVGPQTWHALETHAPPVRSNGPGPVSGDLRQRILQIAESQIGTLEIGGNNVGPVTKYPGFFGRGAESYCADFVSWVYTHAGKPLDYAYVPFLEDHLKAVGQWKGRSNPQPGDLVLFDWNGDGVPDHVGIVKQVNGDGTIETIEGNTGNPVTGREGVWERRRPMSEILGFGNA